MTKYVLEALQEVGDGQPGEATELAVVAAYIDSLAKDIGLSGARFAGVEPPAPAHGLIGRLFRSASETVDVDDVRERLYGVLVELADDPQAMKHVHRDSSLWTDVDTLGVAQVYWNLEGSERLAKLPLRPKCGAAGVDLAIPVPGIVSQDFAPMVSKDRIAAGWVGAKSGGSASSSSGGLRIKAARLAVLIAQRLVTPDGGKSPKAPGAELVLAERPAAEIRWTRVAPAKVAAPNNHEPAEPPSTVVSGKVVIGSPPEVGSNYQRRNIDAEMERLWSDGGDSRIWLQGGPGLGKSYLARKVMQDALSRPGESRPDILIWVDSADPGAVVQAFAQAARRLPDALVVADDGEDGRSNEELSHQFLQLLRVTERSWLIVLDNADTSGLIEAQLVPPGTNRQGRVLVTTLDPAHLIGDRGHVVSVGLFSDDEAAEYVRQRLSDASEIDRISLAHALGMHPLGLSCAVATIRASGIAVKEWIEEFGDSGRIDETADVVDPGGYRVPLSRVWEIALERAAQVVSQEVVQRAAMVAAVQDPDGHPLSLWSHAAVSTWVGGGTPLEMRHGRPIVVSKLVDFGLIARVNANAESGGIAMHQLVGRAVREALPVELADGAAAVLADAWLTTIASSPVDDDIVRANVRALQRVTPSDSNAGGVLRALAASVPSFDEEQSRLEMRDTLSNVLLLINKIESANVSPALDERLAHYYALAASLHEDPQDVSLAAKKSERLLLQRLADPSVSVRQRARRLRSLSEVQRKEGNGDGARESLETAAKLLAEQVEDVEAQNWDLPETLIELASIYEELTDSGAATDCLRRALGELHQVASDSAELLSFERLDALLKAHSIYAEGYDDERGQAANIDELVNWFRTASVDFDDWKKDRSHYWLETWELRKQLLASGRRNELHDVVRALINPSNTCDTVNLWAHQYLARHPVEAHDWPAVLRHAKECVAISSSCEEQDERGDDLVYLASVQANTGDIRAAYASVRDALEAYERRPPRVHVRWDPVLTLKTMAFRLWDDENFEGADDLFAAVVETLGERSEPGDEEFERELADALGMRGLCQLELGHAGQAQEFAVQASRIYAALAELSPESVKANAQYANSLGAQADVEDALGNLDQALALLSESVERLDGLRLAGNASAVEENLVMLLRSLSGAATRASRPDLARESMTRILEVVESSSSDTWDEVSALELRARTHFNAAALCVPLGDWDEAYVHSSNCVRLWEELVEIQGADVATQLALAKALRQRAAAQANRGRLEEAVADAKRAVDVLQLPAELDSAHNGLLGTSLVFLGTVCSRAGQDDRGVRYMEEGLSVLRRCVAASPDDAQALFDLGSSLAMQAEKEPDYDLASPVWAEASELLRRALDLDAGQNVLVLFALLAEWLERARNSGRDDDAATAGEHLEELLKQHPELGGADDS